jgi:hypothetical protein
MNTASRFGPHGHPFGSKLPAGDPAAKAFAPSPCSKTSEGAQPRP